MDNERFTDDRPNEVTQDIADRVAAAQRAAHELVEIVIDSPQGLDSAGRDLRQVKAYQRQIDDLRKSITRPMDDRKKSVMAYFSGPIDFLDQAEGALKHAISSYRHHVAEEARKLAAAEAKRIEQQAKREAKRAEKKGETEEAEVILDHADTEVSLTLAAVETRAAPEVKGIGSRKKYSVVVTDKMAFINAVATGSIPDRYVDLNMTELNKLARALKTDLRYPGIVVKTEDIVTARSA